MIKSFKLIEAEGYTYKAEIVERVAPRWKFWNNKTVVNVYVGNSMGWYNLETGAKLANKAADTKLANLMRSDFLQKTYGKKTKPSHLTPIK